MTLEEFTEAVDKAHDHHLQAFLDSQVDIARAFQQLDEAHHDSAAAILAAKSVAIEKRMEVELDKKLAEFTGTV